MLKLKPLLIGVLACTVSFAIFLCVMSLAAKGIGNVTSSVYQLLLEIFSSLAVFLGALIAARLAWGRGAIYGGLVALFWISTRILYSVIATGEFDPAQTALKSLILLALGFVGGVAGISRKKRRMI